MIFENSYIEGVIEIIPQIFEDERGFFYESYQEEKFRQNGIVKQFVQDNHSFSYKNVLRGLHFQKTPHAQAKLVRVLRGSVLDVIVDVRKHSPTFGQHVSFILDTKKHNMVYVPEGLAHGFLALEDSIFTYKCSQIYHPASETGVVWDDPILKIDWGIEQPIISHKDRLLPKFESFL